MNRNGLVTFKLELDIAAQRIISQFQGDTKLIEDQISKGIEKALTEILSEENFTQMVCDKTKQQIETIIHQAVVSYEVRGKITKAIDDAIGKKIAAYADQLAEKMTNGLK